MREVIDWNILWMTLAFEVSERSKDPSTQHGCIIVDHNNKFVSMGYNSFPRDCLDDSLPTTRPEKYKVMIHSEINAIENATNRRELIGSTAYITGHPCPNCFGSMLNAGISRIIIGPVGSHCLSKEDMALINQMNISASTLKCKIQILRFEYFADMDAIYNFLDSIKENIKKKLKRTGLING
ncbi:hypothetical protein LCGC14_1527210 [marine sediment metagenome]|uniref:CMP/dCMP-type deaminase domain-containing protein n=1 Tax=marine sediment metagenome TaxID=412755 RepID=A0A0F9LCG5_9ZZZZ